jgi:hypothetical protein
MDLADAEPVHDVSKPLAVAVVRGSVQPERVDLG